MTFSDIIMQEKNVYPLPDIVEQISFLATLERDPLKKKYTVF